jgi:chromosome segregation ATPase
MGPEELSLIMSPQFINATFRAGEDWYNNLRERAEEAEAFARRRNAFEAANAQYAIVNRQILNEAQRHNAEWKRHTENIVAQFNEQVAHDERAYAELRASHSAVVADRQATMHELSAMTAVSSGKDTTISNLQSELAALRASLNALHEALDQERQSVTTLGEENKSLQVTLQDARQESDRLSGHNQSLLAALRDADHGYGTLKSDLELSQGRLEYAQAYIVEQEAARRDRDLADDATSAAVSSVMMIMAQVMSLWAVQGKTSLFENPVTSHTGLNGQPLTLRDYLWLSTLVREMQTRNVPDRLIRARCPVKDIEVFLTQRISITE